MSDGGTIGPETEGRTLLLAFALVILIAKLGIAILAARALREEKVFFKTFYATMKERGFAILVFVTFGVTLIPILNLIPYFYAGRKLAREVAPVDA